jgi:hypothetical protein
MSRPEAESPSTADRATFFGHLEVLSGKSRLSSRNPICPIGADAAHSLGKMIAVQRPRRLHGDTECTVARHAPIRFNLKSQLLLYIMESLAADLRIANR